MPKQAFLLVDSFSGYPKRPGSNKDTATYMFHDDKMTTAPNEPNGSFYAPPAPCPAANVTTRPSFFFIPRFTSGKAIALRWTNTWSRGDYRMTVWRALSAYRSNEHHRARLTAQQRQ